MAYYLAVDAGGTKLDALLFDDRLRLISCSRSGGVNTNSTTVEDCRKNVQSCLDELLKGILHPTITKVYITFIGPVAIFRQELERRAKVLAYQALHEGVSGLLAGAIRSTGVVAVSGTGSNIYMISNGDVGESIGGWGPIISDRGSGTWMGRRAMEMVEGAMEGWLPSSPLVEAIKYKLNAMDKVQLLNAIYSHQSPYRKMASLMPTIGACARNGDEHALKLLLDAGDEMARQTVLLLQKEPMDDPCIVCCGGAWKAHPAMFERFQAQVLSAIPEAHVQKPYFEHVMAGVVQFALDSQQYDSLEEIQNVLMQHFAQYQIGW